MCQVTSHKAPDIFHVAFLGSGHLGVLCHCLLCDRRFFKSFLEIIPRYRSTYFNHIFGSSTGYSAGYYSYLWANVLDNDAFEAFKEHGIFDKNTADLFRHNVLEKGDSEDPMVLYKNFRGTEPSLEPLLKNRGMK